MRIWYVIGTVEYWLEPEYSMWQGNKLRVIGCKLYDRLEKFKGYWNWQDIPAVIQKRIKDDIWAEIARQRRLEMVEKSWQTHLYDTRGKKRK